MDGFNVISVDKDSFKNANQAPSVSIPGSSPLDAVEIFDEEKEKAKTEQEEKTGSLLMLLSILALFGVFCYLGYLVVYRISLISEIMNYSDQLNAISKNIDVNEMQEFQSFDATLKAIDGRLSKHVIASSMLETVNQNIRKTLQISQYRLDVQTNSVDISLDAVAPSFKELAEQTEKLFVLKSEGAIKSFSVTSMSFEADTKRVKFSLKITFDKSKVTVVN